MCRPVTGMPRRRPAGDTDPVTTTAEDLVAPRPCHGVASVRADAGDGGEPARGRRRRRAAAARRRPRGGRRRCRRGGRPSTATATRCSTRRSCDQLGEMAHVMFGGLTHPAGDRAGRAAGRDHPGRPGPRVPLRLGLGRRRGGDEDGHAVLARPRPARRATGMLTVRGGYHGDTLARHVGVRSGERHAPPVRRRCCPQQLFAPRPRRRPSVQPFDESHVAELARLLRRAPRRDRRRHPRADRAGRRRHALLRARATCAAVRALCDETDVLLIADEIATGFGRTGRLFGCDHAGVTPDIMCVGKAMTGGYLSMAATLCTPEVAAAVSSEASRARSCTARPTWATRWPPPCRWRASGCCSPAAGPTACGRHRGRGCATGLAPGAEHRGVADVRVLGAIGVVETVDAAPDGRPAGRRASSTACGSVPSAGSSTRCRPYVATDADVDADHVGDGRRRRPPPTEASAG